MSLPRLLAGTRGVSLSLREHEATHGRAPTDATARLPTSVDSAGLRGRGGASFPTIVKLRAVAEQRGPRILLVNGGEGEPMSAKDRVLMALSPHLVLDGAIAAAAVIDAREIVVAVRSDATDAETAMRAAVSERGLGDTITVAVVPATYLAGEETALIRFLNGGPLKPTSVPPRPVQRGLRRRPTLVQNPETLAHLALIARHGPDWYRQIGTDAHPGSTLVTMAGAVRAPGVLEISCGAPLALTIDAAGGATQPLRAVLVGGYHGVWIADHDIATATLDNAGLARHGGGLGAGVVFALAHTACPVTELADTVRWLADSSAQQCGPCSHGLPAIAATLRDIARGHATGADARLHRWGSDLIGRGACHLPDGAVRFLTSGMRVFADEIAEHQRYGPCAACSRPPTLVEVSR